MQTNVLEYLEGAACTHPDKTAFADEKAAFTFSQFLHHVPSRPRHHAVTE